ncbi:hypothetical protein, partial [Campylobacter lanienae]|uniref:hypothetical protein n=2 Tax=Campylobacter lanienae TaxID=75658 RepID=UPI00112FCD41
MAKNNYELLGFVSAKAVNGLMIYSSADSKRDQIDIGEISDVICLYLFLPPKFLIALLSVSLCKCPFALRAGKTNGLSI